MSKQVNQTVTAIIKSFERPQRLLHLVESIRKFYPELPLVIIDDSKKPLMYAWDQKTKYVHTDYYIGTSAGRNMGVKQVTTPYALILDDDFLFVEETKIEVLLNILQEHSLDLIAGDVFDYGIKRRTYHGLLEKENNHLVLKGLPSKPFCVCDFVVNFFLARTAVLLNNPWDDALKTFEHEEFFWRLKSFGASVAYSNLVSIHHFPISNQKEEERYAKKRLLALKKYYPMACKKIGVVDTIANIGMYEGGFGVFNLYAKIACWIKLNRSRNIFANFFWHVLKALGPPFRFLHRIWKGRFC